MFIWERKEWPEFTRQDSKLLAPLAAARLKQGRLLGEMSRLGFKLNMQAQLGAISEDVIKSSEIEGEHLDRADVRSSVAERLGLPHAGISTHDPKVEGAVAMLLDATQNFNTPLTKKRLYAWQAALFPTGYAGLHRVRVGKWRNDVSGPMQVVSGPAGKPRVHYQAPPAARIEQETRAFLQWFNNVQGDDGLIRAAIAHLWFVSIHPFEDGNGRVARAIADMALAQSEGSGQRFYSMSAQIRLERKTYYDMLETTQKGTLDVTPWLVWFLECFSRAIDGAADVLGNTMRKADFWQKHNDSGLHDRQKKVLNRWLEGIEGNMTARKWAAFAKCSMPTAQRDISDLINRGIVQRNEGGSKNTSYKLTG